MVNKKYLIIDEISVIGQTMFRWINRRCKQATGLTSCLFGNLPEILVGDIAQLPPIADKPLYYLKPVGDVALQGFHAHQAVKLSSLLK